MYSSTIQLTKILPNRLYSMLKQVPLLNSEMDIYKCVQIKSNEHQIPQNKAKLILEKSIQQWKLLDCHAIWFSVHIQVIIYFSKERENKTREDGKQTNFNLKFLTPLGNLSQKQLKNLY